MKKILVMSALVAISTAFVACSNENDLVQQNWYNRSLMYQRR